MSDVKVANGQCDYPFEANIETTGHILLGAEFSCKPKYYSVGLIVIVSIKLQF